MLTDVPITGPTVFGGAPQRIQQGVYRAFNWNFELSFRGRQNYELDYPDIGELDCYGVCDSPEQLLSLLPTDVLTGPTRYVISLVEMKKSEQPSEGGWRWHKWGEYVGTQKPQCEYLYDEPEIQTVWTYHVYKV